METPWRIEMFGCLRATHGEQIITRFQTHKAGVLLAYLSFHKQRTHGREELMDMLWKEGELDLLRNRFKQAIWSLRRQFETPDIPAKIIFLSDKHNVQINPDLVTTDLAEFEAFLKDARVGPLSERRDNLERAIALYQGELLPGCYEEWILDERQRLADAAYSAFTELMEMCVAEGDSLAAIEYGKRAVTLNPLLEDVHCQLMRIYLEMRQPGSAIRQYQQLQRSLSAELNEEPSAPAQELWELAKAMPSEKWLELEKLASTVDREQAKQDTQGLQEDTGKAVQKAKLPLSFSRFFGRNDELQSIKELLAAGTRIVTLVGPGGCGKTRLSVEAGYRGCDTYEQRVWFVPLADLTDASSIPTAIVNTLRKGSGSGLEAMDAAVAAIEDLSYESPCLLILDNYEHLADEGALIVRELLERCPYLQCLITSRHKLNLEGEREVVVWPLPVPSVLEDTDIPINTNTKELLLYPSVAMFLDRAQCVRAYFQITPRNARSILELCCRLEGIPLAIELAAGWVQTLTPIQMLQQLEHRLDTLVSRRRDINNRHRTLRAAIDYSYCLLGEDLKEAFKVFSVFRGGFTLEAALQMHCRYKKVEIDDRARITVQNTIASLNERSLIISNESEDGTLRFRMLDTILEFAQEQLSPQLKERLSEIHSEYYLEYVSGAEEGLEGPDQPLWKTKLDAEMDNIRAAINWAIEGWHFDVGYQFAKAIHRYWIIGSFYDGRDSCSRLLALADKQAVGKEQQATLLGYLGNLSWKQAHFEAALTQFQQALEIWEEVGDEESAAWTHFLLGITYFRSALPSEARKHLEIAGVYAGAHENTKLLARVQTNLGNVSRDEENFEEARRLHEDSLRLIQQVGDLHLELIPMHNLAEICRKMGDFKAADYYCDRLIEMADQNGYEREAAGGYDMKAIWLGSAGESAEAYELLRKAMSICIRLGDRLGVIQIIETFGCNIIVPPTALDNEYTEDIIESLAIQEAVLRLRTELNCPGSVIENAYSVQEVEYLKSYLSEEEVKTAVQRGKRYTYHKLIEGFYSYDGGEPSKKQNAV